MIEYALLCQTITDWRAGRRPNLPQSAAPTLVPVGVGTGTAPISLDGPGGPGELGGFEDDGAEVIEAGEADLEDDGAYAVSDELETEVPVDDDYGVTTTPPPDYDSTMVYGAGGAMPGQWPAESELGGATPPTGLGVADSGDGEPPRR